MVFKRCTGLTDVYSNASIIHAEAFMECPSLTGVTIGPNTTKLVGGSFGNCNNLRTVRFLGAIAPTYTNRESAYPSDDFGKPFWWGYIQPASGGTLYYPAGADYESWKTIFPDWTYVEE